MLTDNEVNSAMTTICTKPDSPGFAAATCVMRRGHYRRVYEENFRDRSKNLEAFDLVRSALENRYTSEKIKWKRIAQKRQGKQFPVLMSSGDCENSINLSPTLESIPVVSSALIFVHPEVRDETISWLSTNRERILSA